LINTWGVGLNWAGRGATGSRLSNTYSREGLLQEESSDDEGEGSQEDE
jgi:hypothetical protein